MAFEFGQDAMPLRIAQVFTSSPNCPSSRTAYRQPVAVTASALVAKTWMAVTSTAMTSLLRCRR